MTDEDARDRSDAEGREREGHPPEERHRRRRKAKAQRKDRLIQTRVPEGLESALKAEAHRRRLTVSHLIRNMLEDTFNLVDGVVEEVDQLVGDSMDLAFQVGEDAQKIAQIAKRSADRFRTRKPEGGAEAGTETGDAAGAESAAPSGEPGAAPTQAEPFMADMPSLEHVLAWNEVLLNQDARCARCAAPIAKGSRGFLGLSQDPSKPAAWLCVGCASAL